MECSESLAPHFVNNDHVTAEVIYSTVHACHKVLTWLWATLCSKHVWTPLREWWHLMLHHGCVHWSATRGENIACLLLWLLHHSGERLCLVGYAMAPTMVAASARRECMCLQFLQLLKSSSGLLPCLPWVQWKVCTVGYSKTIGITNRISDTTFLPPHSPNHPCRLSESTGFGFPMSDSKFPLAICFTYSNASVSMLLSQIILPFLSHTVSKSLFSMPASPLPCR